MRLHVPPVSKDNFSCSGDKFYVTMDGDCISRESSSSLYAFLTYTPPTGPVLTEEGTPRVHQPRKYHDKPARFYCAQLLHYGLKSYKTKEAAKKHLLAAFDSNHQLAVPEKILQIEKELKAEYARANAVAEKAYQEKKRQAEAEEADRRAQAMEKRRQAEAEEANRRAQEMLQQQALSDAVNKAYTTLFGDDAGASDEEEDSEDDGDDAEDEPTQKEIKQSVKTMPEADLRELVRKLVRDDVEAQDAVRTYILDHRRAAVKSKAKKPERPQPVTGKSLKVNELQGKFEVISPDMSNTWSFVEDTFSLNICPSSTTAHLWGGFQFGMLEGVLRSTNSVPSSGLQTGFKLSFKWRGRETGEGESSFEDGNTGYIVFLGDGLIKGNLVWASWSNKGFGFSGRKRVMPSTAFPTKQIKSWKREYRGYNRGNYEAKSVSRWGKWAPEARPDSPENSDTSAGEDTRSNCEMDTDDNDFESDGPGMCMTW
ncbi:hypothetical protein D9758_005729 [Tetrapyrgos nigripes]|uniref:Uncharacterized protein n=1 Tax=Tetrapyrgos nigripes TaxID=182062 RepID=A0A8H5GJF0_9AGAR|nr:hypothetical protein D9758_005729 [Tetrapyrgos nigripes]